jgi:hypothetical protein
MTVDLHQPPLRYGDAYDELSADGLTPRPHWAHLMDSLQEVGTEELGRRWARAERRIRENGITYNVYGDPEGASRPWRDRHRSLSDSCGGVASHRGRNHSARPAPQPAASRSLRAAGSSREGSLSCRTSLCQPGILEAAGGRAVPAHSYLHMLAVDLARSPDGQWWVLADRTQAPSGSGYAWRIAPSFPTYCPISFALRTSCGSLRSFVRSAKCSPTYLSAIIRESFCLLPDP